jgi:urease subunit gamma/beta
MHLTPRELEKLMLHQAGAVAQKRFARGLRLNYAEAMALIAAQLLEFIREGDSVATLMDKGKQLLGFADVMDGVAGMIHEVQVEGTFPDGTKLVTVHRPICRESGDPALALHGSGFTRSAAPAAGTAESVVPGELLIADGELELNAGRKAVEIQVMNTGDRPVQVGSHYPFFETNRALRFDRAKAFGRRLDIPSGTAVRFEPGESKRVALIEIDGEKLIYGGNALTDGGLDDDNRDAALARVAEQGFENG